MYRSLAVEKKNSKKVASGGNRTQVFAALRTDGYRWITPLVYSQVGLAVVQKIYSCFIYCMLLISNLRRMISSLMRLNSLARRFYTYKYDYDIAFHCVTWSFSQEISTALLSSSNESRLHVAQCLCCDYRMHCCCWSLEHFKIWTCSSNLHNIVFHDAI